MPRDVLPRLVLAALALMAPACAPVYWVGAKLVYDKAPEPPRTMLAVSYDPAAPDDPKRQLDLYLPAGRDFPEISSMCGCGQVTHNGLAIRTA